MLSMTGFRHMDSHLHPAGSADAGVRNVAVAADLIRGVNNDHALVMHL